MLRAGALPVLLRLIAADNMMVIEVATMVLALLCIECEAKLDAIKLNAIPLLVNLLEKKVQSHDKDCCRCGANAHFCRNFGESKGC